jgi:hypothetical protein
MSLDLLAAPGTYPVPTGRGRWRLTLHRRNFSAARWDQTIIGDLSSARSRGLDQTLNGAAELRFTIDGRAADAATITELSHEVYAWRWDDQAGADVCVFRGVIDHSQDAVSEQSHAVNFVAHDYLATVERRFVLDATAVTMTQWDQDRIVAGLLARAGGGPTPTAPYQPGSIIPLGAAPVDQDGAGRALTSTLRDRTYVGQKSIGEAIDELAHVQGGFDYDVLPEPQASDTLPMVDQNGAVTTLGSRDALRLFFPTQGRARNDVFLLYGGTVAAISRTVASGDYANHVRSLGNNASSDPAAAQLYGQASNADAPGTVVGWWPYADGAPTDVNQQSTLDQRAAGVLATMGVLVPSYSVTMRPGAYRWGAPRMGDTVPLLVNSGRLNVNTTVRVVGIRFDIGDDGDEDVELTVGRPLSSLADLLARTATAVDALARR